MLLLLLLPRLALAVPPQPVPPQPVPPHPVPPHPVPPHPVPPHPVHSLYAISRVPPVPPNRPITSSTPKSPWVPLVSVRTRAPVSLTTPPLGVTARESLRPATPSVISPGYKANLVTKPENRRFLNRIKEVLKQNNDDYEENQDGRRSGKRSKTREATTRRASRRAWRKLVEATTVAPPSKQKPIEYDLEIRMSTQLSTASEEGGLVIQPIQPTPHPRVHKSHHHPLHGHSKKLDLRAAVPGPVPRDAPQPPAQRPPAPEPPPPTAPPPAIPTGQVPNLKAPQMKDANGDVRVEKFMKFIDKNRQMLKKFIDKKRAEGMGADSDGGIAMRARDGGGGLQAEQLDLSPARGARINDLRLKGRLCQRSIMRPEGPKYNSMGQVYVREFKSKEGYHFTVTKAKHFVIPVCCNCCRKSVLGCM